MTLLKIMLKGATCRLQEDHYKFKVSIFFHKSIYSHLLISPILMSVLV